MYTNTMRKGILPEWIMERYLLEELPPQEMERVKREIENNPENRKALEELKKSNTEILNQYPVEQMALAINREYTRQNRNEEQTTKPHSSWANLWKTLAVAAPIAAMVLVMVFVGFPGQRTNNGDIKPGTEVTRVKGNPSIFIFRKNGNRAEQMIHNQSIAKEGDVLQIQYLADGAPYGTIVSIDGNYVVTLHFPGSTSGSTSIEPTGKHLLDYSYKLDNAPSFERFFFVTSDKPIDVNQVMEAAKQLASNRAQVMKGSLVLPDNWSQVSTTILKEVR